MHLLVIDGVHPGMHILGQHSREVHIHIFVLLEGPQDVIPTQREQRAVGFPKRLAQGGQTERKTDHPAIVVLQHHREVHIGHLEIVLHRPIYLRFSKGNEIENMRITFIKHTEKLLTAIF